MTRHTSGLTPACLRSLGPSAQSVRIPPALILRLASATFFGTPAVPTIHPELLMRCGLRLPHPAPSPGPTWPLLLARPPPPSPRSRRAARILPVRQLSSVVQIAE